jgi:hypothetical protein
MNDLHWSIAVDIPITQIPPYSYQQDLDFLSSHSQPARQNRNANTMQTFHHILFHQLASKNTRDCPQKVSLT